jgi:hypothetical protein
MVNDQTPRQACRGGHIRSVRGRQGKPFVAISLSETLSRYADTRGADPALSLTFSENRIDLFTAR